jgi:hypothetical protein
MRMDVGVDVSNEQSEVFRVLFLGCLMEIQALRLNDVFRPRF